MVAEEQRNIRVFVRVRPNNRRECETNQRTIIKIIDKTTLLFDPEEDEDEFYYQGVKQNYRDITKKVNKKLSMEFDGIFEPESSNADIFDECTKPLVESVLNGYNCSVFVYGATGAGKTYTMLGNNDYPGITFLTMKELFDRITELSDTRKFEIGISYLEVYNEQVMNLINKSGPLKLREDSNGVVVSGLVLTPIHSADELIALLLCGNKNRTQHPTDANAESSRSHAIFQVHIRMTEKKTGQKRTVKLSMIDLAGSERAASTKGIGLRFKEGASINKSLLALGNCINKLADGLKHIPYRDSNLTRILKDSLGGNCQTVMIANVSPSSLTFEDTYNTLKYASRAKKIRTTIRQNIMKTNMPKDYYVKKLSEQMDENEKLKETIKQLEAKLENSTKSATNNNNNFDELEFKTWSQKVDTIYSAVIKAQEYYFDLESKEKILALKAKKKSHADDSRKALYNLNPQKFTESIAHMEDSSDRLTKQTVSQKEEMDYWRKRYEDSVKDLENLRQEIKTTKSSIILYSYLKGKDREIECSKLNIQFGHLKKVQEIDHNEGKLICKTLLYSFQILQHNNSILRTNHIYDNNLDDMYNKLIKMINTNGQYNEQDDKKEIDNENVMNLGITTTTTTTNETNHNDVIENKSIINNNKRKQDRGNNIENLKKRIKEKFDTIKNNANNNDANIDNKLLKSSQQSYEHTSTNPNKLLSPIKNCNLNETQIVNQLNFLDDDANSTFVVPVAKATATTNNNRRINNDILKSILTDANVNVRNGAAINKVLMKTNITKPILLSKFAATASLNKENKRFSPNKIRKSPRAAIGNRALNTAAAHFLNRQRFRTSPSKLASATSSTNSAGRVRLNRAASMRTKK